MSINPLNAISKVYLEQVASQEVEIEEGMTIKDFKANRRNIKRREASTDAKKRGHVGKEWYNSGRTYSPDEAKRMRSKLDDEERSTRHRSALDPEGDDSNYSADKTKNPKKLRKQKAMGELGESSHLEKDMKKRRKANEKAVEDMKKTDAYKSMAATAAKKFDESVVADRARSAVDNQRLDDEQNDTQKSVDRMKKGGNRKVTRASASIAASKAERTAREMHPKAGKKGAYRIEALDPVGQEDADIDNDGDTDKSDAYLKNRRKVRGAAIGKKKIKEGFSNWRQDLFEIIAADEQKQIKERKVKNNVKTSAMGDGIKISEAVEQLGGQLVEMIELDEDYIFEGVLDEVCDAEMFFLDNRVIYSVVEETILECIEDGYDPEYVIGSILESLDTSIMVLNEEDNPKASRRRGVLQKVKSAVKAVGKGLARGVGYAAGLAVRGAKSAGREVASGYQRGRQGSGSSPTSSSTQDSRKVGDGEKEEGVDKKPGLLSRIGSKLKRGLRRVIHRGASAVEKVAGRVASRTAEGEKKEAPKVAPKKAKKVEDPWEGSATTPPKVKSKSSTKAAPKSKSEPETGRPAKRRKGGPSYDQVKADIEKREASKKAKKSKKGDKLDALLASVRSEAASLIGEKTLTPKEMSKREEIVKSMKSKAGDFEKRYPGRGKEVMYATATKMAKKIAK